MIFIVCFRPLSGILLFIQNTSKQGGKKHEVFVPYRGFCYLYQKQKFIANSNRLFSSPIGDFVIYTRGPYINTFGNIGFRPLSGILLFIRTKERTRVKRKTVSFRPLSGILLFILLSFLQFKFFLQVFVPYRGFCYLYNNLKSQYESEFKFSSPIGDFVIYTTYFVFSSFSKKLFSSPIGDFVIYTLPPCNPLNKLGAEHIFGLKNFMYINYVLQLQKSLESGLISLSAQTLQSKVQNHSSYFYIMYTFSYEAIPQTSQDP